MMAFSSAGLNLDRAKKSGSTKKDKEELKRLQSRRPLQSMYLEPPEYTIDPELLLKDGGYYEREVRYSGIIKGVSFVLDSTNRTEVLRIIDKGMRDGAIPYNCNIDHDAIFTLNVNNIKISRRDGDEETLLRIPIAEVANICFIQDDNNYLLGLKYGNPIEDRELCKLAIMYTDKADTAHEICSLVGQCFQIVYTEATMQCFDKSDQTAYSSHPGSTSTSTFAAPGPARLHELVKTPQFFTPSHVDRGSSHSTVSRTSSIVRRHPSDGESDIQDTTSTSELLLRDYMEKLPKKLNPEELKQFATLLSQWQTANLAFEEFCVQVIRLYGVNRRNLLYGMKYFIPDRDISLFETVLEKEGIPAENR